MSGGITLVQISADGSAIDLGPIAGLPGNVTNYPGGDFGADGLLYIDPTGANSIPNRLYGIDVDAVSVVNVVDLSGPEITFGDMALNLNDNLFYAVTGAGAGVNPGDLVTLDIIAGTTSLIGPTGLGISLSSMWADASGNVFGGDRFTGLVYQFDTQTGSSTVIGETIISPGDEGPVEGFSCSTSLGPFAARPIPTLSQWGLIAMAGILGIVGFIMVMRRRKATA